MSDQRVRLDGVMLGAVVLLFLAGAFGGFGADVSRDWDVGGRYRVGRDAWTFIGLLAAQFWFFLVPGVCLSLRRGVGWRFAAVGLGFGAWIALSAAGVGGIPPASGLRRGVWAGMMLFLVWFIPVMRERTVADKR